MGAIRLFLALGVVFGHTCGQLLAQLGLPANGIAFFNIIGGRAVILFYVVSGFLISYVLEEKYAETGAGTLAFFRSRALRILPLWWAILFFSAAIGGDPWLSQHSPLLLISPTLLLGTDWLVPFWHYPDWYWDIFPHSAGVGWTLGAELTFYLMAPWILRSTRLTLALFAASAAIRASVYYLVGPEGSHYIQWSYFFFPATLMFFLAGHLARLVAKRISIGAGISFSLFFAALAFSAFDPPISIDRALSYGSCACFALSLPGIFAATKDNRFSNYLGDLTYPVYLTHTATLSALFWPWAIAGGFGNHLIEISKHISVPVHASLFLLMVVLPIALAVAVVVHHLVERPLRAGFDRILDLARPSLNSAFRPVTVFVNRSMRRPLD